jgi:hypothetical protein
MAETIKNAIQEVEATINKYLGEIESTVDRIRSIRTVEIRTLKKRGEFKELLQDYITTIDYHQYHLQVNLDVLDVLQKYDLDPSESSTI